LANENAALRRRIERLEAEPEARRNHH
jgi:hypothetical protein